MIVKVDFFKIGVWVYTDSIKDWHLETVCVFNPTTKVRALEITQEHFSNFKVRIETITVSKVHNLKVNGNCLMDDISKALKAMGHYRVTYLVDDVKGR